MGEEERRGEEEEREGVRDESGVKVEKEQGVGREGRGNGGGGGSGGRGGRGGGGRKRTTARRGGAAAATGRESGEEVKEAMASIATALGGSNWRSFLVLPSLPSPASLAP